MTHIPNYYQKNFLPCFHHINNFHSFLENHQFRFNTINYSYTYIIYFIINILYINIHKSIKYYIHHIPVNLIVTLLYLILDIAVITSLTISVQTVTALTVVHIILLY